MKSAALDTSVVMRLLTGTPEDQAHCALHELMKLVDSGTRVIVSDLVVSEAYLALQHHYHVPKVEALSLLEDFLSSGGVRPSGAAGRVLTTPRLATAKPGFIDRLIHANAMGAAEELLTFETASRRLKHVRVLRATKN